MSFRPQSKSAIEVKSVDDVNQSFDLSQQVHFLSGIAQGSDFNNRIGRKSKAVAYLFRGMITPGNDTTHIGQRVRVALVYDEQPNGTVPAYGDIFQDFTSAGVASSDVWSGMNLNNRDRFKVLKDWTVVLGTASVGVSGATGFNAVKSLIDYKRLNLDMTYKGTTASISDVTTGAFYLVSDTTDGGVAPAILDYNFRLRYTDI